jgi:hypothetical protein
MTAVDGGCDTRAQTPGSPELAGAVETETGQRQGQRQGEVQGQGQVQVQGACDSDAVDLGRQGSPGSPQNMYIYICTLFIIFNGRLII